MESGQHTTTHRRIDVDGLVFDVALGGPEQAPAVVLLHGFPVNSSCFDAALPRIHDAGLRTVTIDQRGYSPGARPDGVENYRLDLLVSDVIGVLDQLSIPYSLLVGHDWGGIVAWHLAGKHPERFTGLVAVSTGHPSATRDALQQGDDQREKSSYIKEFVAPGAEELLTARNGVLLRRAGLTKDELAPLLEPGALTGPLNWYRANFTGDIAETLECPPIDVPTTMLWSNGDATLGRTQAELTGRYVYGDYRFSELDGVDHWIPQNAPEALAAEIALRSATF
ncbi:MAG: alpha/beta hydrolase [Gordonia sp. (in: high G+C Gram-positive bacteria)]|uniref:alpha/beta fold hydrolase n=1 Tax=Gordonia sp. (in: high G+C Gram-positive bacteria) TaxID=84139 RepID=UPI0039E2D7DF